MDKPFGVEQLKAAFRSVEEQMTPKQRVMLEVHFKEKDCSTGRLAKAAGFRGGYRIANMQYGAFCGKLAKELNFNPEYDHDKINVIANASKKRGSENHFQWRMDREAVQALTELGWFKVGTSASPATEKKVKKKFMVVYEHAPKNYSGFAPDILGAVSVGKDLMEMRRMMKECLEAHLSISAEYGYEVPEPKASSFDFGEIRDSKVDHYVVEWLEIEMPGKRRSAILKQAA